MTTIKTLKKCDRESCGREAEGKYFGNLSSIDYKISNTDKSWQADLCATCFAMFQDFMGIKRKNVE